MIQKRINLKNYGGWIIQVFLDTSSDDVDEIMERLWSINVNATQARKAYQCLSGEVLNTGLCYSNLKLRQSVIVVALTSSSAEFFNSLVHEIAHACIHISSELGIDLHSEGFTYLMGDVCIEIYSEAKRLLCDCCRNKHP